MTAHRLYASNGVEFVELPTEAFVHCAAIQAMIDVCPDSSGEWTLGANLASSTEAPEGQCEQSSAPTRPSYPIDKQQLDFIVEFLYRHKDDEQPLPVKELHHFKELDEWESTKLEPFQGLRAIGLLFAAKYLGHNLLLRVVGRHISRNMETRNEKQIQQYFGVKANFTQENEEATRQRFPEYFA